MDGFRVLWGYLGVEIVQQFQHAHPSRNPAEYLEPWTLGLADWGRQFGALELERALQSMVGAARSLDDFFRDYDVVLSPVVSERPPVLGQLAPTRPFPELLPATLQYMGYTQLQNMAGTPAISLPLFTTADGIPLGSMFAAGRGQDAMLLSLAFELEQAQPWGQRWPGCFGEAAGAGGPT
jgi:amidase